MNAPATTTTPSAPKEKTTTIVTYLKVTKQVKGDPGIAEVEQAFAKARELREKLKDTGAIVEGHVSIGKAAYKL